MEKRKGKWRGERRRGSFSTIVFSRFNDPDCSTGYIFLYFVRDMRCQR